MAELEQTAVDLGYRRIHLTTGPRQPEARNLYLAAGYTPRFDPNADPETIGPLAFAKELLPGAGFAEWVQPTWADIEAAHRRRAGQRTGGRRGGERTGNGAPDSRLVRQDRFALATGARGRTAASAQQTGQRRAQMSTLVFVGGGPRTVGLLERLAANAAELLGPGSVDDPRRRPVPGRRWTDLAAGTVGPAVDELDGPGRHDLHRRVGDVRGADTSPARHWPSGRPARAGDPAGRRTGTPGRRAATGRLCQQADPVALPAMGLRPCGGGAARPGHGSLAQSATAVDVIDQRRPAAGQPLRRSHADRRHRRAGAGFPRPAPDARGGRPVRRRRRPGA